MPMSPPVFLRHLIDDAAIFPPGNAPMDAAVHQHLLMQRDDRSAVVGPFVVDVARLTSAAEKAKGENGFVDVSVVVRAPATVEDALRLDGEYDAISVRGLEIVSTASGGELRAELDTIALTVRTSDRELAVWIELGWNRTPLQWAEDVRGLAAAGFNLKLRTGGVTAEAFPSVEALGDAILAAAEAGVPFKCTAGLHSPARHFDSAIGVAHHGFLNILIATARARVGASSDEIRAILALEDGSVLARAVGMLADDEMQSARELFRSYGSCSIDKPLAELRALGLLAQGGNR